MNKMVQGFDDFPSYHQNGVEVPSTPAALWIWLRGGDRGQLLHKSRQIVSMLSPNFVLSHK